MVLVVQSAKALHFRVWLDWVLPLYEKATHLLFLVKS